MPQYAEITGDERVTPGYNAVLIPGLHGVGMVDGRKVSVVKVGDDVIVVPAAQVEVWTAQSGHPASGLRYESSDRKGWRIACVNRDTGTVRVLARITDTEEGDPAETELYRNYSVRVRGAIEALGDEALTVNDNRKK